MNHISGKIEQLLSLQEALCKEYEKENKSLLETNRSLERANISSGAYC